MTRKPIVAGMFYEKEKEKLKEQILNSFNSKFGPGSLPAEREDKKIIGIIAPHAGYKISGPGQAWSYKELGESETADTYIILGTAHSGFEESAVLLEDFETPFGKITVDQDFAKRLIAEGAIKENKEAHEQEHSIEVQLPFLQFVKENQIKNIKIVPIVVGAEADHEKLGKAIAKVIKQTEKKVILICSSDFTHYGVSYGYLPFKENIKENLRKLDQKAISWIEKFDAWSFLDYIKEKEATICGKDAIAAFIIACKELNATEVEMINYYSSGEVTGDWTNVVSYCSMIVK